MKRHFLEWIAKRRLATSTKEWIALHQEEVKIETSETWKQRLFELGEHLQAVQEKRASQNVRRFPKNWDEYFNSIEYQPESEIHQRLATHALTYAVTMAKFLSNLRHLHDHEQISVAIIGARAESLFPSWLWEEVVRLLSESSKSRIQKVQFHLIGPYVGARKNKPHTIDDGHIARVFYKGLFHEVSKVENGSEITVKATEEPINAACVFHPGFSAAIYRGLWDRTIELLSASKTPCLITSLNQEDCERDAGIVKTILSNTKSTNVVSPLHENEFCSLTHGMLQQESHIEPIFYRTNWHYFLCSKHKDL